MSARVLKRTPGHAEFVEYLPPTAFYTSVRGTARQGRGHEPLEDAERDCRRADIAALNPSIRMGVPPVRCIRLRANVSKLVFTSAARARDPRRCWSRRWCLPWSGWRRPRDWDRPGLLLVLIALAVIADFNEIPLPGGLRFDAGLPLALITLAVPRPAAGAARRPRADRRRRRSSAASRSSAPATWPTSPPTAGRPWPPPRCWPPPASTALGARRAAVAAARRRRHVRRELLGRPGRLPAAVPRPCRSSALPRMFFDTLPDRAGDGRAWPRSPSLLVGPLGVAALAIFALIAVLPQTALTLAARTRPVARAGPADRDAPLLARAGAAPRAGPRERRHLARVTELAFERRADAGDPIAYARQTLRDPRRASWEAGHVGEWWNGGGGPAGLRGPVTPITSRIVAVADTWSALTARAARSSRHADALVELENAAGTRFDPRVVQAALRRRGRGARVRDRAGPGAAPARAAPARAAAPRHRLAVLTIASTSRAVRSQVNSRARARGRARAAARARRSIAEQRA